MLTTKLFGVQSTSLPSKLTMNPVESEEEHLGFTTAQAVDHREVSVVHLAMLVMAAPRSRLCATVDRGVAASRQGREAQPMPGNAAVAASEVDQLLAYLAQQRYVARLAAYGLTTDEATSTPSVSTLRARA